MNVAVPQSTLGQIAARIRQDRVTLAEHWLGYVLEFVTVDRLDALPNHRLLDHLPEVLADIATHVESADPDWITTHPPFRNRAAELGALRHLQHASIQQLLREHQILADLLEALVEQEVATLDTAEPVAALQAMRRINEAVRVLQHHAVDGFVAHYTQTLEKQTSQLRKFSRLVSHEIRQPLAVLQVIARALPDGTTGTDSSRMMDIFERSLARLTDVTGKLERLARIDRQTDLAPNERRVDLTEVAHEVAGQLAEVAVARGVDVRVVSELPVLRMDPMRAELIFINLLGNAIKYCDPNKAYRYVEIERASGEQPSVIIRDNGVGMAAARVQTVFREFVRAHSQRDDEVRGWGLGLGLSIVRECMDHSNGFVRVDSLEGRGTTFKLTWPSSMSAR
jgi:signal transduction histidine kinase